MQIESLTIPSTYAKLIIDLCISRNIDIQPAARHFDRKVLEESSGRLNLLKVGNLLHQTYMLDHAIGYEIGLKTQVTSHGFVGYGVLTNPTFRDALDFGINYVAQRTPFVYLKHRIQNEMCIIEVQETFDLGPARQVCMDLYIIGIWRIAQILVQTTGLEDVAFELYFQHPQPEYHDQYCSRLPRCHFSSITNQVCFPAKYLDLKLTTADEMAAQIATRECEREEALTGEKTLTLTFRVKSIFEEYLVPPPLGETAGRLHISERSLKRKLKNERTSYQKLADHHLENLAINRLMHTNRSITDIASELGYTAPENFTRAFRKWTGFSPSKMRKQRR